jgi:hypothetical protein
MTQVERIKQLIELGYFDFFGLGTDVLAAEEALDAAVRIDACPVCRLDPKTSSEQVCLSCEDWRRHHSIRGWAGRSWRRYVTQWFIP